MKVICENSEEEARLRNIERSTGCGDHGAGGRDVRRIHYGHRIRTEDLRRCGNCRVREKVKGNEMLLMSLGYP